MIAILDFRKFLESSDRPSTPVFPEFAVGAKDPAACPPHAL
jgi:hypothetical protein